MLIVRKEMKNEIVEYMASNKDALEIEKYNMHKDRTHKANKFIDLNKTKVHDRYFANAGRLFEYLVLYKGYEKVVHNETDETDETKEIDFLKIKKNDLHKPDRFAEAAKLTINHVQQLCR